MRNNRLPFLTFSVALVSDVVAEVVFAIFAGELTDDEGACVFLFVVAGCSMVVCFLVSCFLDDVVFLCFCDDRSLALMSRYK